MNEIYQSSEGDAVTSLRREIGRVAGWRYVIVQSGIHFEVLRQDVKFDQVEEALCEASTFKSAARKAVCAMVQETIRKRQIAKTTISNDEIFPTDPKVSRER